MGISGLLPLLKSIQRPNNLRNYKGQTIGVDAYGWLHRATATCAVELALDKPTTKYVDYVMHRVRMLIHFGVTPYIVFDGDNLPSKAGTEKDRRERRKEGKRLGLELLKIGKTAQAHIELQKSVDVTPEMARMVIEQLKHHNVQYVVAPYEADSQLCYLERHGIIDGVLSEDSDLLVFGVKRLLTKLDKYGDCIEINRTHFTACREVSFVGWSDADFRRMAILSGCDYLPGIGGLGLKTAHRMLRKHKTVDRLVKAAQFEGKLKVPNGFLVEFDQAEKTFLYQWVFCPKLQQLVNLTPLPDGLTLSEMPYIGEEVPAQTAIGVSRGDLYPRTKLPIMVGMNAKRHDKPLIPSRRTSAVISTPDLKGSKPIDSFFKPKRTPLAELDPNSFTPSPSQQALLQQQRNGNTWAAVPAPLSRLQQSFTAPRTAPQPARRVVSESVTGRLTAPNPSKRQRLCSESMINMPTPNDEGIVRSSFFASSLTEASPSLRTSKQRSGKNKQTFELYSDDSIQDAMLEAADLQETASQSYKKLNVFSDSQSTVRLSTQSSSFSTSGSDQSQDTAVTSVASQESETGSSAAIASQIGDLRSNFTYKSSKKPLANPSSSQILQRKLNRRKAEPWAPTAPSMAALKTKTANALGAGVLTGKDLPDLDDSAWAAMGAEVVVPASSPPPITPQKRRRSSPRGSEDLLVADSEGESDCSPRKPMFNLNRFAFSG